MGGGDAIGPVGPLQGDRPVQRSQRQDQREQEGQADEMAQDAFLHAGGGIAEVTGVRQMVRTLDTIHGISRFRFMVMEGRNQQGRQEYCQQTDCKPLSSFSHQWNKYSRFFDNPRKMDKKSGDPVRVSA